MKIQDNAYVSIEYTLSLDSDEVIDRSDPDKPFGFIFGASQVIVGLQKQLEGMEQGQSATFTVEPEEGYGQPIQELFREIPREQFPSDMDIEPNMVFEASGPQGPPEHAACIEEDQPPVLPDEDVLDVQVAVEEPCPMETGHERPERPREARPLGGGSRTERLGERPRPLDPLHGQDRPRARPPQGEGPGRLHASLTQPGEALGLPLGRGPGPLELLVDQTGSGSGRASGERALPSRCPDPLRGRLQRRRGVLEASLSLQRVAEQSPERPVRGLRRR